MNLREGFSKKVIRSLRVVAPIFDVLLFPVTLLAAVWFRVIRFWGVKNMPLSKWAFLRLGVFPIVNHYYEPLFDYRKVPETSRDVHHIDFNDTVQLEYLSRLDYGEELKLLPAHSKDDTEYRYKNGSFEEGDSELYYSIIRKNKPKKILEIGSGYSTLIALKAIEKNKKDEASYTCELTCVEPYEMPYLEKVNVHLIRQKIETVSPSLFTQLRENDILFVDSSHIQRPGGDVNYLILKVLPILKSGVLIHFHDIFLPKGYPVHWLRDEFRLWNEQYLLEAFLIGNHDFEIVVALNHLNKKFRGHVEKSFPLLAKELGSEPASFWIRRK